MVTLAQLEAEVYWREEVVTAELDWLGDELCRRLGRPRTAAGSKGDRHHLNGGHRSQRWILNSRWCTNRSYTVQSGLTTAQEKHIAGFDFTPAEWGSDRNRQLMIAQTDRLVDALLAGRLDGVREVIGTRDGRNVIAIRPNGATFSADDSHLEHWHLTIDRRRCADGALMERICAIALGEDLDDMTPQQEKELRDLGWQMRNVPGPDGKRHVLTGAVGLVVERLLAMEKVVAGLAAASPLTAEQMAELRAAAEQEAREEVAELRRDLAELGEPPAAIEA